MNEDNTFPFTILHPIGGGSRSLTVPQTSISFSWTGREIAKVTWKGSLYILTQEVLCIAEDFSSEEDEEIDKTIP
jgi:hypothetical protein